MFCLRTVEPGAPVLNCLSLFLTSKRQKAPEMGLGIVQVPAFLEKPTGVIWIDVMPAASLITTLPTLLLFYNAGRRLDFVWYSLGFVLAMIFHLLHTRYRYIITYIIT